MASIEFDEEKIIKEIMRQIETKIPKKIDLTVFCDRWGTIWCSEDGSTDEFGHPLPRVIACRNCIEKSIKDNPDFLSNSWRGI